MSQKDDLLEHLKAGNPVTTLIAMKKYGICRLSERIRELEAEGYNILHTRIEVMNRHGHMTHPMKYTLTKGKK